MSTPIISGRFKIEKVMKWSHRAITPLYHINFIEIFQTSVSSAIIRPLGHYQPPKIVCGIICKTFQTMTLNHFMRKN